MITASQAGGILGYSKYNTRRDVMLKKFGYKPFKGNVATRHGQLFEDIAVGIYETRHNTKIFEYGLITHPTISYLGASPDGITKDGIMVEIKCPYSRKLNGNVMDKKTLMYWVQMQMQLEVCGLLDCDFLECTINKYNTKEHYLKDKFIPSELSCVCIVNDVKTLDFIKVPNDRRSSNGLEKGLVGKFYNSNNNYHYN